VRRWRPSPLVTEVVCLMAEEFAPCLLQLVADPAALTTAELLELMIPLVNTGMRIDWYAHAPGAEPSAAPTNFRVPVALRQDAVAARSAGVTSLSMSDDPKSATGLIVQEVAAVVPQSDKDTAGRDLGKAFKNVGSIARDLTDLLAGVASVPRRTSEFIARALAKFRQIPNERRRTPSPRLLLEAAQGYVQTDDADLRACFERLLETSMDSATAALVHPSFVSSLNQMSGLDARFLRLVRRGGRYQGGYEELGEALGARIGSRSLIVTTENLTRLGYITSAGPVAVKVLSDEEVWEPDLPVGAWCISFYFYKDPDYPARPRPSEVHRVMYYLTGLGTAFLSVVSDLSADY